MRAPSPPDSARLAKVATAGLAFVLVVVAASAAIRVNSAGPWAAPLLTQGQVHALRVAHRIAVTLEVLAAAWAFWLLARRREWAPAAALVLLTAGLAALGIAGGQAPGRLLALGNVAGGLALAFVFAWLSGGVHRASPALAALGLVLAVQVLAGARLSIFGRYEPAALPLHAYLGLGLAAWLALSRRRLPAALALAALLAGFSALHYEYSACAALLHALAAAGLVAAAARRFGEAA